MSDATTDNVVKLVIDDDPEGLNDPWANKVWEVVTKLRAVLKHLDGDIGSEAIAIIIADMLRNVDDPEHALGSLVAAAVDLWKAEDAER